MGKLTKVEREKRKPRVVKEVKVKIYDPKDNRRVAVEHIKKIEHNLKGTKTSTRVKERNKQGKKNLERWIRDHCNDRNLLE